MKIKLNKGMQMLRLTLALMLGALFTLRAGADVRYSVTLLEDLSNPDIYAPFAGDISDSGYVMGLAASTGGSPYGGAQVGWLYNPTSGYQVLSLPDAHVSARAVNNQGQVAIYAWSASSEYAIRYSPSLGYQDLGTLGGTGYDAEHSARGINSSGQVAGYSENLNGDIHAFRYTDGVGMQDLGTLGGRHSMGYDLNDRGWVTGRSGTLDGSTHAFLFKDDTGMVDLGLGGGVSINSQGVVGGMSGGVPVLFKDGQIVPAGTIAGAQWYGIGALNDANIMVGGYISSDMRELAFITSETEGMVDLNTLIDPNSGWTLTGAAGINNQGQIVGEGIFEGRRTAFRLDVIPEPSTWALLGLGAVAFAVWRPRRK